MFLIFFIKLLQKKPKLSLTVIIQGEPPPWSSRVSAIRLKFIAVHCCTISLRCGLWNPNDNTEINDNNDNNDNLVLGHPVPLQHVLALFLTLPRYSPHLLSWRSWKNVRLWNNFPLSAETQVACPSAEPLHQVFFFSKKKFCVTKPLPLARLHQNQILSPVVRVAKLGLDWCLVPKVGCQRLRPDQKHFHAG